MDDIKSKFFDLINNQVQAKIPIIGSLEDESADEDTEEESPCQVPVSEPQPDKPTDQEVLKSIDSNFFNSEQSFDPCRYVLSLYEDVTDLKKIEMELEHLKRQHLVVSNHVLKMILEKQSACQQEFNRIEEVQEEVGSLLNRMKLGRRDLGVAREQFTSASLRILANYRKRRLALQLLRSLTTIGTLHKTESQMPKLLKAGDFSGAINLILECLSVAGLLKQYLCIAGLSGKLQDTLEMTEEHLDNALAKICYGFEEGVYKKLQSAYSLLGKTGIAMDQLHMHFTSAVHKIASNVVHLFLSSESTMQDITFASLSQYNLNNDEYSRNSEFSSLCKNISEEKFIPCLLLLCKSLWCLILSYHNVLTWHHNNPIANTGTQFEATYTEQTMKQKLNSGMNRLWHDIQTKVSALVLSGNLANYKFDDFLQILAILHRLSQIGEELCGSGSEEMASSIRVQCSHYFKRYHAGKLDDLRVFLENEAWTVCPVRSDFSLLHLQEFRGLRTGLEQCAAGGGAAAAGGEPETKSNSLSLDSSSVDANFFSRYPDPGLATPFDFTFIGESDSEDILANLPQEDPSGYFTDESEDEVEVAESSSKGGRYGEPKRYREEGPLLTNTTLSVLRLGGKYLQMSKYLQPIAVQVVTALTQLYDFYLYTVLSFFSSDSPNTLSLNVSSLKLQAVLNRIRENLIARNEEENEEKVHEAGVSPVVDLTSPNTLFGLYERIVGVESLLFLLREFNYLKPYLEQLLRSQNATLHNLQQFYSQTIAVSYEVRRRVYSCVAWRALDEKYLLNMMSRVDWAVDQVMSQHSQYVDHMINEIQKFSKRLENLIHTLNIPEEAYNTIWDCLIFHVSNIFVEGFSCSKKCSHAGRGLMMLDYIQLVSKLEKLCQLRPIPYKDFVENYIKGYYTAEDQLEIWIKEHREYTSKQLLGLVSCICANNKKSRQRLTAFIEELESSGIR